MTTLAPFSDADLLALLRADVEAEGALAAGMRALTVRNRPTPWAGLIAAGIKPTENRSRKTNYRGPVLIHASASHKPLTAYTAPDGTAHEIPRRLQACGRILALAVIDGCHRADNCCAPWGEPEGWHWSLTGVQALPRPIPARGALGFWKPGRTEVAEVLRQLANLAVARCNPYADFTEPEHGGLLMKRPSLWPVESCADMNAPSADLYAGGGR